DLLASAPIEEDVALAEPEADAVVMLAGDDEVAEEDDAGTEIELQPVEEDAVSAIDQSLDDFFDADDLLAPAPVEESVDLAEPEADDVVLLGGDDEIIDEDDEVSPVIELVQEIEEPPSATADHRDESFKYGEVFPKQKEYVSSTEQVQSLEGLKTVILAIDQDLSAQILQDFSAELGRLKALWEGEKVLLIFLHLLESLGSHLETMGEHRQPNTIQLLLALFSRLEKAASTQRNDVMQHGMLLEAIKLYIKWNEKNIGAVLLPEQKEQESGDDVILLGSAEEMSILEPID
ncbi:MAG: hypothetical protein KKD73_01875, partial [Proteobacteria bacterium]|nr:hypothetical protein [Pseudomonadota bacterium]MBU1638932.1 hypothetical protein [Pseudomonadota bacterium]